MQNKVKLCAGPMSKLVVDSVLELKKEYREKIMFIPSRRQVEFNGGYVNGWKTEEFSKYVGKRVLIQRDHGGPGQGLKEDDGIDSYIADSSNFDMIHIDPWKKYPDYKTGLAHTVSAIKYLHKLNNNLKFEVGTEEAIRRFEVEEFSSFISDLKDSLSEEAFEAIKYAVVQSGVGLDLMNMKNTGTFSSKRLVEMIEVCSKFGLSSKEHNGDYLSLEDIRERFSLGLSAINIAPEFGQIQTEVYMKNMNNKELEKFHNICLSSGKWKKWVKKEDIKDENDIIRVCGHYVFSTPEFKDIRPNLDSEIKIKIKKRLSEIVSL